MSDTSSIDAATLEELHLLGIAPNVPFHDLNLAGVQGVPPPEKVANTINTRMSLELNEATFIAPVTSVPPLAPHDLMGSGIDLHSAIAVDPLLLDLTSSDFPYGLQYERPQGQSLSQDLTQQDSLLPDLQHPDLTQQVQMQGRPGDLDESALNVMHANATYQLLDAKSYPEIFMDQASMNNTRSRHMDLLMRGLDTEERS